MDQDTRERLQKALDDERTQHMALLEEHGADPYSDEVKNLDIGNDGFADSAQATEERSELLGQIEAARHRVQQVDAALEQIAEGTYGVCQECGEDIQLARLEVRPLSVKCVDCAAKEA